MIPNQSSQERILLLQVAAGDEQAFRVLTHQYSGLVFKFIHQHLNDRQQAEEIVQDIFVKLWLTRETLAQIDSFRSFLLIVCRNHAFNAIKKMVRERNREWEWDHDKIIHQTSEEDPLQKEQLFLLIEEAVEKLPPQQQKAWKLCRQGGLKYEQAAHEMQVSRDAVKKYLQYANDAIKKYVSGKLPIYHP